MHCEKSSSVEYICEESYEEYNFGEEIVTWDGDAFSWYSGAITGTIDGDDLIWDFGMVWERYEVGKI